MKTWQQRNNNPIKFDKAIFLLINFVIQILNGFKEAKMQNLDIKKVVITGGSAGIGKETARLLRTEGAEILITGRDQDKLAKVAKELNVKHLAFDMSDLENLHKYADECIKILGGVDILINNAGIGSFSLIEDVQLVDLQQVFNVNLFGLTLFSQPFIRHFRRKNGGDIVNLASTAGVKGFAYGSIYASSKFAVGGLTQCWQAELRKDNIRVILINPSEVPTAFNSQTRTEREEEDHLLTTREIAHTIKSTLLMDKRGFIPEVTVWATNPTPK